MIGCRTYRFLRCAIVRLAIVGAVQLCAPWPACAEWTRLADTEIIRLLSGANFAVTNHDGLYERRHHLMAIDEQVDTSKARVAPKSAARSYSCQGGCKGLDPGWWWVDGGQLCLEYRYAIAMIERCFAVEREGADIRFVETTYVTPGPVVHDFNEWQPSARMWRDHPPGAP